MSSSSEHLESPAAGGEDSTVMEDVPNTMFGPMEGSFEAPTSEGEEAAEEADDMTCAICLERTPLIEIALVKGCEHQYCVNCILQWSLCKEWCPQCKHPFDYLLTHKQLDGTVTDFLTEESVVLLKRARWFEDYMRTSEKGKATLALIQSRGSSSGTLSVAVAAAAADDDDSRDWADLYEDYLDAELEEDEEIESYYFSSAAGRARVVLGNRRWGEGGYMRAGRMYARPVVHTARTPNAAGGKATTTAATPAAAQRAGAKAGASSSSASGSGTSKQQQPAGGAGSSSGASSSSGAAAGGAGASSGSSSRGRQGLGRHAASSSTAPWLDEDLDFDDDEDFTIYETDSYSRGGGAGSGGGSSSRSADRSCSSSSRTRARMIKPQRQVPKSAAATPAVASAACPVVNTPLGRSPGSAGLHGSWGVAGKSPNSFGGMWAAAAAAAGAGTPGTAGSSSQIVGSAPGSGRRARRNARRAAADTADYD